MAAPAVPDIWTILWPVIIGGGLALLPSIVGQILSHTFETASAKLARSREQYLTLAAGISEFEAWVHARTDQHAYGGANPGPNPLPRVMAIAALDFPILLGQLDAVASEALKFELWQAQAGTKRLRGEIGAINDGFNDAYAPFLSAISDLKDELRVVGVHLNDT